jgi:(2Fe-2S) ferredoxin
MDFFVRQNWLLTHYKKLHPTGYRMFSHYFTDDAYCQDRRKYSPTLFFCLERLAWYNNAKFETYRFVVANIADLVPHFQQSLPAWKLLLLTKH